ncbi:hypothetical protein PHYPSEUDO_012734 [Phytophthora pseudosyringae]|uniref:Uncharacterized protein n=1 Tax=Phytophthora pseudosyringae TaxID=221518 RepID=A0A8T1W510_9STRA|nr:hypothetical protein PHYPSEUDO_012734 [Phytophthora pseudosyringae]
MELGAWRDAVSYGAHLQPIHLQVAESTSAHSSTPAAQKSPSPSAQNSRNPSHNPAEGSSNGTLAVQQLPEASTDAQTTKDAVHSTGKTAGFIVIPPFASEGFNGGEQMALNVGGPVWAMDWLPSKPAANAAAVTAALIKSKQKKPRRPSAASKKAQKAALKGKENNLVETPEDADGETTAASNGSTDPDQASKLEWRFLALATHPPCQVEDNKVVKATPPDHYYDVPESARNLIQIWAVPVQRPKVSGTDQLRSKAVKKSLVKPRMVYAIDHESGVAWDLQWCPLVKKLPKTDRRSNILGVLAVCFGDGSMRVFEIPTIPEERLQATLGKEEARLVEKNTPIVVARLPKIMQLSVQWSPHSWNMLLTGGSEGSVSLWNIKSAVCESDRLDNARVEPEPIEPQRRFQDADTIGKQEAFDWGCGWVAIRAVAWSPFDEHLFATTGNDSVFKVWDVREPRICLRSHRIRSTWGLALQWMDQTSVQISGDQGSVYMYDILSGSYQKLHYHPQIDSPVWDLQFARRGAVPLLVSSCTSGSIRAAPAKKLYRAPQNCVEICRLSGEKDSSVEKPFKSLTVSFEKHSVVGSADSVSLNTREFCERDAALHRLRLSSATPGDYPCFLAAGGHAGLVLLFEVQEVLDTLISTFFLPPSKKIGRPKKIFATVAGHHVPKKMPSKQTGVVPAAAVSSGRKARTLGSFAKAKGMHTALSKYKKKSLSNGKAKAKAGPHAMSQKKSFIQDDGEVEVEESVEEEEEPEFEEVEEDEDESDLSLVMEDISDDDRISVSDDDVEEEEEPATTHENPEEARLMKEYQLDLSEEDAVLLAIQMSTFDDASTAALKAGNAAPSSASTAALQKEPQKTGIKTKSSAPAKAKTMKTKAAKTAAKAKSATKAKAPAKAGKGKKRARPSSTASDITADLGVAEVGLDGEGRKSSTASEEQPAGSSEVESKAPAVARTKPTTPSADATPAAPKKSKPMQPKKVPARKTPSKPKRKSPMLLDAINQAMALQAFEYQMGMSEEDALKEALRLSEMGLSPAPSEAASGSTPTQPKQIPAATPRTKGGSQKNQKKVKALKEKKQKGDAVTAEEDTQPQRPQTPRRLQFSPLNGSEGGDHVEVPPANITDDSSAVEPVAATASTSAAPQMKPSPRKPSPKKSPAATSVSDEQKQPAKSPRSAIKTPKQPIEKKQPASASAAAARATPEGKKPAKRSRSTGAKAPAAKKRKKTATTPRRSGNGQGDIMSEEDALLLALKMSEIEY